jgi:uncharacterized membrane protein YraQ (UPF0718 family)
LIVERGRLAIFDGQLAFMLAVLLGLAVLVWLRGGEELVRQGLSGGGGLLLRYAAVITVSFLAAGLVQVLVPTGWVEGALGDDSGLRGIVIATLAGMATPSGPFVSMPVAAVMIRSGASTACVVAFVSAWSLLAVHRLVAWEVPILGLRFAALRYGVSLVLPVLAGLVARALLRH